MTFRNLVAGQFQCGNLIMGRGTNIIVENFDVKPDDINVQDYSVQRSEEKRFGQDYLSPTTLEITATIMHNEMRQDYKHILPNFWQDMPNIDDFAKEWRFDEGRHNWGEMKALYVCDREGNSRMIYGRPGQFSTSIPTRYSPDRAILAEWRRADTKNYSVEESGLALTKNEVPDYIQRIRGNADSWLRIVGVGPLTNPKIVIGEHKVELNRTIPAGESFEISSYPWQRRAINNKRENLSADLAGTSPYLDKLTIPPDAWIPVRWRSDEVNTWVPALGNEEWNTDIQSMGYWDLPETFEHIHGRTVVRTDIFNPRPFRRFIGAGLLGSTAAVLYKEEEFNSREQYSQARIVEPFRGSSGIVIMSNATMTNFVILEVQSGVGNNRLRLRTGSAYNALSTPVASWTNPSLWGWSETDDIYVESHWNGSHMVFSAGVNDEEKISWIDETDIVNQANRKQGYIFDINGSLLTTGTGFRNLLSYDKATVPAPVGSIHLMWRDAWSIL